MAATVCALWNDRWLRVLLAGTIFFSEESNRASTAGW
ncbi:hypothetical protein TELCIR_07977 [Teladorsagia circumcincta]|uniref:Uncharacterized protein n=1 Tax=Teladorsagia circumcincta TaxID=45464 RepID=A0A2G9UJ50_TELCI|nr:hypothetical protein TELCIR_07977 [Teladorsagia circumcincta]